VGSPVSFEANQPLTSPLALPPKDTLRLTLTVKDGKSPGRPHQAFLLVKDDDSDLETFFPLNIKESTGKAKVEISHKDIPAHLLDRPSLSLSIALGSSGDSKPLLASIGSLAPVLDPVAKAALEKQKVADLGEGSVVYEPKDEIRHVFRDDPKNPPKAITLFFTLAVLGGLVGLFGVWFPILGANFSHLPKALQAAPIYHPVFFVSLIALEAVFFMYYTSWNLFQTLPAATVVGVVAFFSGSRALREVMARRERGER